jgi:hypothetical protein
MRLLQDDFDALCARLARHPDEDVRQLVEEAMSARACEGEIYRRLGFSMDGIGGPECVRLHHAWVTEQFAEAAEAKIRGPGSDA